MIIATLLVLQVNHLWAGNDIVASPVNNTTTTILLSSLAPVTPKEATFEDAVAPDFTSLAPVTPAEAAFEETTEPVVLDIHSLAPVTPAVADFE